MTQAIGAPTSALHIAGDTYYIPDLTNSGYIDGLVIDTGPEESAYADAAVDRLAITHGHADHFACGYKLRERGATVVAARDGARPPCEHPRERAGGDSRRRPPVECRTARCVQRRTATVPR